MWKSFQCKFIPCPLSDWQDFLHFGTGSSWQCWGISWMASMSLSVQNGTSSQTPLKTWSVGATDMYMLLHSYLLYMYMYFHVHVHSYTLSVCIKLGSNYMYVSSGSHSTLSCTLIPLLSSSHTVHSTWGALHNITFHPTSLALFLLFRLASYWWLTPRIGWQRHRLSPTHSSSSSMWSSESSLPRESSRSTPSLPLSLLHVHFCTSVWTRPAFVCKCTNDINWDKDPLNGPLNGQYLNFATSQYSCSYAWNLAHFVFDLNRQLCSVCGAAMHCRECTTPPHPRPSHWPVLETFPTRTDLYVD